VLGGRVREGRPVVTLTIIAVCVASFAVQWVVPDWTARWAFSPAAGQVEPLRFISAAFLHARGSIAHIGFNMYALWLVGPYLEHTLGRWRFAALYLLCAVGGSVGVLLFASPLTATDYSWVTSVVGASGAVFGLFGAVLVVLRRLGRDAGQILVLIGINAVIGFVVPGIAWQAHLGGLVTGLALGAAIAYAPRGRRDVVAVVATAGMALLLVVLALAKYASV